MKKVLKPIIYGVGVFSVYIILTYILRSLTGKFPLNADYFGVYTTNDLLLGIVVAAVLTLSNEKKKNLKNK